MAASVHPRPYRCPVGDDGLDRRKDDPRLHHLTMRVDALTTQVNLMASQLRQNTEDQRNATKEANATLHKISETLEQFGAFLRPKMELESAQATVEQDVLKKAAKWRQRYQLAKPIAAFFLAVAIVIVAGAYFLKTGINILPLVVR